MYESVVHVRIETTQHPQCWCMDDVGRGEAQYT